MSENPYQSPAGPASSMPSRPVGVKSPDGVRKVANYQRAIIFCILANLGIYIAMMALQANQANPLLGLVFSLIFFAVGITQLVFIVMLAIEVYSLPAGILLGILSLIPCVGLIILLVVNQKATKTLQDNGIRVGLMGADMSQFAR